MSQATTIVDEYIAFISSATNAVITQLKIDDAIATGLFTGSREFTVFLVNGKVVKFDLSWIAEGSFFHKACAMLPDSRHASTSGDFEITLDEPLCGEGYAPPLPES